MTAWRDSAYTGREGQDERGGGQACVCAGGLPWPVSPLLSTETWLLASLYGAGEVTSRRGGVIFMVPSPSLNSNAVQHMSPLERRMCGQHISSAAAIHAGALFLRQQGREEQ